MKYNNEEAVDTTIILYLGTPLDKAKKMPKNVAQITGVLFLVELLHELRRPE